MPVSAQVSAQSALVVSQWEETPAESLDSGTTLARATSLSTFTGELDGSGLSQWTLVYTTDGGASFVGTQSFTGSVGNRAGSFVLALEGTFVNGAAAVTWTVIAGTGTGELTGISGSGGYTSVSDAEFATATLEYELP